MRNFLLAAAAACAFVSAPAMAGHVVTLTATPPAGLTVFENFDDEAAGTPIGVNSFVFSDGVSGTAAKPSGAIGNFAAVLGGGNATFLLPSASALFGFELGSLDSFNTLTLGFDNGTFATVAGSAITNGLGSNGFLTYDYSATSLKVISANFSSSTNSFEFDTLAFGGGAVPEPTTWALLILGFGMVGGAMRRRTNATVAFA